MVTVFTICRFCDHKIDFKTCTSVYLEMIINTYFIITAGKICHVEECHTANVLFVKYAYRYVQPKPLKSQKKNRSTLTSHE